MKEPHVPLKHLTRVCLLADLTLMLAWSAEEAGKIIETYKIFEHKPPDMIMERQESDPHVKVSFVFHCLTSVLSIIVSDCWFLVPQWGHRLNTGQVHKTSLLIIQAIDHIK